MNEVSLLVVILIALTLVAAPGMYSLYRQIARGSEQAQRLDELEAARRKDSAAIAQMHVEIARMAVKLERWQAYALQLADIMRRNGLDVPPAPDGGDETAQAQDGDSDYDTTRLLRLMAQHFNIDELNDLAFQLRIETGALGGESFNARARALIGNVQRNGRLAELVALCRQLRPNAKF